MVIDIGIFLTLTVLAYYGVAWCLIEPYERGFYCNDQSIRNELRTNTVSSSILLVVTLGLPLLIILITNTLIERRQNDNYSFNDKSKSDFKLLVIGSHTWWDSVIKASTYVYLDYVTAFFILTLSLDLIKCCVGRLRPNFVAMCKPDNLLLCDEDPYAYIPHFKCTSTWKYSRNSRLFFFIKKRSNKVITFILKE